MIPIQKEDDLFKDAPAEDCCFCWKPTRYWYTPKDVAVCPTCAKKREIEEVPSKKEWCELANQKNSSYLNNFNDLGTISS